MNTPLTLPFCSARQPEIMLISVLVAIFLQLAPGPAAGRAEWNWKTPDLHRAVGRSAPPVLFAQHLKLRLTLLEHGIRRERQRLYKISIDSAAVITRIPDLPAPLSPVPTRTPTLNGVPSGVFSLDSGPPAAERKNHAPAFCCENPFTPKYGRMVGSEDGNLTQSNRVARIPALAFPNSFRNQSFPSKFAG